MNYICKIPEGKFTWDMNFDEMKEYSFFETDQEINFYDRLKINNILYYISMYTSKELKDRIISVKEFHYNNEEDLKIEDEITCPYCNKIVMDSWEHLDDESYECDACGSIFSFVREITIDYWSKPVKKNTKIKELENEMRN